MSSGEVILRVIIVESGMMDFYTALNEAEKIEFERVHKVLIDFLSLCVIKSKRRRWIEKASSPQKLYAKFNDLWNSLNTEKVHKMSGLSLNNQHYIYYCMDAYGYLLSKETAEMICRDRDGFLFSTDLQEAIFLTHEGEYYVCQLKGNSRM